MAPGKGSSELRGREGVSAQRYEALHGGGGYLADRYIMLFLFFVALSSAFRLQLRKIKQYCTLSCIKASVNSSFGCIL